MTGFHPPLTLLDRRAVARALQALGKEGADIIRAAYAAHGAGRVINPHSLFLLPPGAAPSRIIALPAGLFADEPAMGMKWIASFPSNLERGLERASALIVLNDPDTGYPNTVLEGAAISAWRTARSASLAAALLRPAMAARNAAVIGCGLIAAETLRALAEEGWPIEAVALFDSAPARAHAFAEALAGVGLRTEVCVSAAEAAHRGEIIVFATTASAPWFDDADALAHHPAVLHLSLRDLDPAILLDAANFVDDIEHASRAGTSVELAARRSGDHRFVDGTVGDLIAGTSLAATERTAIFSPFGLGMLDIAVANAVAKHAESAGEGMVIPDFFRVGD